MNLLVIPKESRQGEQRVALVPEDVLLLSKSYEVRIEEGSGLAAGFKTQQYVDAGAKIISLNDYSEKELHKLYDGASLILRVKRAERSREIAENAILPENAIMIGFLDPLDTSTPHVNEWLNRKITTLTLDQLSLQNSDPRNVLAAMSSIAGKLAVRDARSKCPSAQRALIIGTGSAGLSAIQECQENDLDFTVAGTNQGLKDKYKKFVHIPQTLSEKEQQSLLLAELSQADIVIATARRTGSKAPLLITQESLKSMKQGSVIVDLALTEGGNVEGSENDQTKIIGNNVIVTNQTGYPKQDPFNASILFSHCLTQLIQFFSENSFKSPLFDAAHVTYQGKLNPEIFNKK